MLLFLIVAMLPIVIVGLAVVKALDLVAARTLKPASGTATTLPHISVIIPARNEALRISACLHGLAQQTYRHFDVIVVDDHSTDQTVAVAQQYQQCLPDLQIVASAPLPNGWSGKCWACWQAATQANGSWLLFLDADVTPLPDLLATLATTATTKQVDLISLMPLLELESLAERMLLPAFFSLLYGIYPFQLVNDRQHPLAFANGPCVFVCHNAYLASGGHRTVSRSVLDDVELARAMKRAGFGLYVADAPDLIRLRMYTNWQTTSEGLGKNAVAGYTNGGQRSIWVGIQQGLIGFGPWSLLLYGWLFQASLPDLAHWLVVGGAISAVATMVWAAWHMHIRFRQNPLFGLFYPVGLAIYYGLALRSWVRVRTGLGVTWKGRQLTGD
jgi:hypothetical protein